MAYSAKVISASVTPHGPPLTTLQLRYPKFIHGEFMTHRVFSRNASSSRAIPALRLLEAVMTDPAMPVSWGRNQPGMQAAEEFVGADRLECERHWLRARDSAVLYARQMHDRGVHKQIVNRIIEPWCHIDVVVTATDWTNFFALRRHPAAQPEIKALADAMFDAMQNCAPTALYPGDWHTPYALNEDAAAWIRGDWDVCMANLVKLSVARVARVSYSNHDGSPAEHAKDIALHDQLLTDRHLSPFEHQATPDERGPNGAWLHPEQHGNLRGWRQYRKMIPGECATEPV